MKKLWYVGKRSYVVLIKAALFICLFLQAGILNAEKNVVSKPAATPKKVIQLKGGTPVTNSLKSLGAGLKKGVQGAAAIAKKALSKAARATKSIISGVKAVAKAFFETKFEDPEIKLGNDDFAIVHERQLDLSTGYTKSTGTVEPLLTELALGMATDLAMGVASLVPSIGSKVEKVVEMPKKYIDQLKEFSAPQMMAIDALLLITNILKKRISILHLPLYANRIMLKCSLTVDEDAQVGADGKRPLHAMATRGPAEYYAHIPEFIRKAMASIKFPVNAEDRKRFAEWVRSPIAERSWKIAADSRSKGKFSERNTAAREWIPLVEKEGRSFTSYDVQELQYWLKVHVGEWAVKTLPADRTDLKPSLITLLSDMEKAMSVGGFAKGTIDEVVGMRANIEKNTVPKEWATLPFPEPATYSKESVAPDQLLEYMWNSFKRLSTPSYLSLCPFAGLGVQEASVAIQAAFAQRDRDINFAEKAFQESAEGQSAHREQEQARKKLKVAQQTYRKLKGEYVKEVEKAEEKKSMGEAAEVPAKPEEIEQAKQELQAADNEYVEAYKNFRKAAANFPYLTPEEEMAVTTDGTEVAAISANDRMVMRFKEIQALAPKIFNKALQREALFLIAMGLNFEDTIMKMSEAQIDINKPMFAKTFKGEKEVMGDDLGGDLSADLSADLSMDMSSDDMSEELTTTQQAKPSTVKKATQPKPLSKKVLSEDVEEESSEEPLDESSSENQDVAEEE